MKKTKARKRLSVLLCIVLALSMLPVATSAAEGDVEYLYCDSNGQNWQTGIKANGEYTLVTSDDTSWSNGWYVVEGSIANSNRITVNGDVHLILADGCEFNATSGILVNSENSLTIYGQSLGTGKLIATAWTDGGDAGIGGVHHSTAGSITINGGNIEATGYNGGAGIGGGHAGAPQSVTINGGNVIANGGACGSNGGGAGIGCGYAVSGGTVKINGGTVVANGSGKANQNAPGIGGGSSISSDNTTVIINGGVVTATCLDNSVSGIGGKFSTGTDGNAVIFTNSISDQSSKGNWNGIIFEDNDGSVYGTSITLTDDFTIESDITLTVSDGQTLIISDGVTLTNNGTIANNGTIVNNDTITNNGIYVGTLPMVPVMYLDKDGTEQTAICNVITADNIGEYTTINEGWYVVQGAVSTDTRITVSGEVHLILADGCTLTAGNGIQVQDTNALTVYAQANGTGTLTATGGEWAAGIGGSGGNITINGGIVNATGGNFGAGIGGGGSSSNGNNGGTVTINGGTVIATGGIYAAGIGGGAGGIDAGRYTGGSGANVTINGGTVIATSKKTVMNTYAPGIGGGIGNTTGGAGGSLTVTGGYVVTNGIGGAGSKNGNSPGANGTFSVSGNSVVISGYIKDSADTSGWNGIVFIGDSGTSYGTSVTPAEDFEIPGGKTLKIANGQTLTIPAGVTLTNNGTIIIEEGGKLVNNGTIINNGTITNNGTYTGNAPKYSATYLDADGTEQTAICNVITADNIGEYTTINSGWYVVQGAVSTDTRITVSGTVHLILADDCTLTASKGITVQGSNSLTIYGQASGTGALTAGSDIQYASIGSVQNQQAGTITINGGIVNATGALYAAGIGGGSGGAGGSITINGGSVTANGNGNNSSGGAGIGGGNGNGGCNITIKGGTVIATGKGNGAGIGGGNNGTGCNITINGGTVTATSNGNGAGIGGGTFSTGDSGKAVIFASTISDQSGKTDGTWSGVFFEGNADGVVYGTTVTPTWNFTIAENKKLLIPTGSELTISGITAVNEGSVYVDGVLSGSFGGTGSIYYPLTVTGGTAGGDTSTYLDKLYGKAGGTVTLTGTDVPVGQAVSGWTSGETVVNNPFTMPASALTVTAQYVNAPTYTVTISATVELGEEITISATGVNVVSGSQLEVKLSGTSEADNSFKLKTDEGAQLSYSITKDSTALTMGSTVLTVAGGTADNSGTANLSFVKQGSEAYSGAYKGTVTFTVSVETVP